VRSYTRQARHHQRVEAAARAAHDARIASLNAVAAAAAAGARTFGGPLQLQPPRPRLADFIPPPQEHTRHVRYREPIEEPRTPPGHHSLSIEFNLCGFISGLNSLCVNSVSSLFLLNFD